MKRSPLTRAASAMASSCFAVALHAITPSREKTKTSGPDSARLLLAHAQISNSSSSTLATENTQGGHPVRKQKIVADMGGYPPYYREVSWSWYENVIHPIGNGKKQRHFRHLASHVPQRGHHQGIARSRAPSASTIASRRFNRKRKAAIQKLRS